MLTFRKWINSLTGRDESGFSLLELVVAVGIVLVLAIGGFISYGAITHNSRVAAVESAAEKTYSAASAAEASDGSWSSLQKVQNDWNASQDQTRVEISQDSQGRLCVSASFLNNDDVPDAHRGIGGACGENGENAGNGGNGGENSGDGNQNGVFSSIYIMSIESMTIENALNAGVITEAPDDYDFVPVNLSHLRLIDRSSGAVIGEIADPYIEAEGASEYGNIHLWFHTSISQPALETDDLAGLALTLEITTPDGAIHTYNYDALNYSFTDGNDVYYYSNNGMEVMADLA